VSLNKSKNHEISFANKAGRGLNRASEKVGILSGSVGQEKESWFQKQFCADMWSHIQNLNAGEIFRAGECFLGLYSTLSSKRSHPCSGA
jgi:hypothetical protein